MKRVLVFALGAVLLVLAGAPDARASVQGVGWWSDSPTASAPPGGIAIGASPGGPSAVAAVLLDLGDGASRASLTLNQSGGAAPAGASIVACVVGAFTPAEKGPMADAPATVCETTSTPVKVSGDGVTWTADITDLVGSKRGTVGIALVPAGSGLFDLQFETVSGTVTPARTSTSSGSGGSTTATTMATASRPSTSSSGSPSSAAPRPAASTFSAPSAPSFSGPAASTATTIASDGEATTATTGAATEVAAGGSVALPTAASTGSTSEPSASASQALGYVLLAAVLGVIGGVGHRVASKRFAAA